MESAPRAIRDGAQLVYGIRIKKGDGNQTPIALFAFYDHGVRLILGIPGH